MKNILILGQSMPISCGFNMLRNYEQSYGRSILADVSEIAATGTPTIELMVNITFEALRDGARKAGTAFTLTHAEIADAFDETPGIFSEVMEALASAFPGVPASADTGKKNRANQLGGGVRTGGRV
jgi:hypothetical protein